MADQDTLTPANASGESELEQLRRSVDRLKRTVADQRQRIEALARGREQGMTAVSELRAELSLVQRERDRLRRELTALEGMQTETLTQFDADPGDETGSHFGELASIDELMATFSGEGNALSASHSTLRVDAAAGDDGDEYQEMIAPELIVLGSKSGARERAPQDRFLALLTPGNHTKCPLDQDLLTIGRSDSADIQIDGDFISRIHARILRIGMDSVIEDAGSRNGTWVNGEQIERHRLAHGDLIRVGSANFRYCDPAAGDIAGDWAGS